MIMQNIGWLWLIRYIQFSGDEKQAHFGLSLVPVLKQSFVNEFAILSTLFIIDSQGCAHIVLVN